jgi:hypothetical protein
MEEGPYLLKNALKQNQFGFKNKFQTLTSSKEKIQSLRLVKLIGTSPRTLKEQLKLNQPLTPQKNQRGAEAGPGKGNEQLELEIHNPLSERNWTVL